MEYIKNMLAAIGLMSLLVLVINTASAGAGKIADAIERQDNAHVAMIANHKAYLASDDDYYVTNPMNGFDDEVYEDSEQYKSGKHANNLIAKAYGRE